MLLRLHHQLRLWTVLEAGPSALVKLSSLESCNSGSPYVVECATVVSLPLEENLLGAPAPSGPRLRVTPCCAPSHVMSCVMDFGLQGLHLGPHCLAACGLPNFFSRGQLQKTC